MSADRLQRLHDAGVSIWLDTLSRELLDSGAFARLIAGCAVTGATSNPTIFARARKLEHARHTTAARPSTDVTVEDHTPRPVFAEGIDRAVDGDGIRHAAQGR
jgi:transaldolase